MTWPWVVGGVVGLVAVDRLALWAESRGWLYWRRRTPAPRSGAGVFGELVEMFEPSHRHVVEEQERRAADVVQTGTDEPLPPAR